MAVDAIVPVRDVSGYLAEALASTRDQGVTVDVTVVDAGSVVPVVLPPASPATLVRSDDPLTAGAARNLGAGLGDGEWITFLDADDLWTPGSRGALIARAVAERADAAVGELSAFAGDPESAARLKVDETRRPALVAGGIVVRRPAWEDVGPFDADLRTGEFVEWFNRLRVGRRIARLDALVLRRRIHLASTTAQQIGDRDDYLEVVRRWMRRNDS